MVQPSPQGSRGNRPSRTWNLIEELSRIPSLEVSGTSAVALVSASSTVGRIVPREFCRSPGLPQYP
jgi:hypothetical protein